MIEGLNDTGVIKSGLNGRGCSITRAVTNERIINPALERTYLGAN